MGLFCWFRLCLALGFGFWFGDFGLSATVVCALFASGTGEAGQMQAVGVYACFLEVLILQSPRPFLVFRARLKLSLVVCLSCRVLLGFMSVF